MSESAAPRTYSSRCKDQLPSRGLDRIAAPWLHLTLRKAGYVDELPSQQLNSLVDLVTRRLRGFREFQVSLIPLAGSPGAVRLSVAPWQPLMELYGVVSEGSGLGHSDPITSFRPHVGVAYSAEIQAATPISMVVKTIAETEQPVEVTVSEVQLVRMWRSDACYQWERLATICFGESPLRGARA